MPFAIDDIRGRIKNDYRRTSAKRQIADQGMKSRRQRIAGIVEMISYSITWHITDETTFQGLQAFIESKKSTRSFDWTPPDDATAAAYKFSPMPTITCQSGSEWLVSATLNRFHGV